MEFKYEPEQIKSIYISNLPCGCIASNRIVVDGLRVGYMYREVDCSLNFPDSGWRFFAGDESDEYTADPNNFHIFELNTICNYDPSIINYLEAPHGRAFIRIGAEFIEDK